MGIVERYLAAVAGQDWEALAACVASDVRRVGPFGDVYEGRDAYVAYLQGVMPTLAGYRMEVDRVVSAEGAPVQVAELSETVELDGRPVRTPESLVFDLDGDGRIRRISIYIQTGTDELLPGGPRK